MSDDSSAQSGGVIGGLIGLAILTIIVAFVLWFLSGKSSVYVVDEVNGQLRVVEEHFYVDDNFLFGLPSMTARWVGMQAPKEINVPGADPIALKSLLPDSDPDTDIIINWSKRTLFQRPVVYYGKGAPKTKRYAISTTRIAPGTGKAVLGGASYIGCKQPPQSIKGIALGKVEIRGWLTNRPHGQCAR